MVDSLFNLGAGLLTDAWWVNLAWPVLWTLIKIVAVVLPLLGCVAYLTLWERKAIDFTQIRLGPNRTGPGGLLQPIADALKILSGSPSIGRPHLNTLPMVCNTSRPNMARQRSAVWPARTARWKSCTWQPSSCAAWAATT